MFLLFIEFMYFNLFDTRKKVSSFDIVGIELNQDSLISRQSTNKIFFKETKHQLLLIERLEASAAEIFN